ncbi:MAG: DUF2950 domain-containing protein [Verrucomicrobiota bacterium]
MKTNLRNCRGNPGCLSGQRTRPGCAGLILAVALLAWSQRAPAAGEATFDSPAAAVGALRDAAAAHDTNAMHSIFGPEGHELVSPDAVQATQAFNRFVQRIQEKTQLVTNAGGGFTLEIGKDEWPFPIPLVNRGGKWSFDTAAGRSEVLRRRIGQDELGAIDVCRAYVDAQREYASQDRLGDGVLAYAQLLHSTPGAHDGLYWPAKPGEPPSPLGPLVAAAHVEGYHHTAGTLNDQEAPYHGYYFKILTCQGRHAPAGKYDYLINGRMIAGFALVAWPAQWANTGVMTFIVNQQGRVYQRNLGPKTARLAAAMTRYDPDDQWTPVD